MPHDAVGGATTLQWVIAALNSIEMVTVPWWFLQMSGQKENGLTEWMDKRLAHLEAVLAPNAIGSLPIASPWQT